MNNFSLKAVPFDSEMITNPKTGQEEYDRVAHSKDLADLIRAYFSNGILVQGSDLLTNELQVLHLSAMSCVVKPGGIIINGRTGFLENEQTLEFDVGTQNPRIDRVVAELNIAERNIFIKVLKGIAETDPKPIAIMQTEDIYQIPLAQVRINANQSVIASVTDERAGYISNVLLNQAPRTDVQAAEIKISDVVRALYGLSVDNANVDKALQQAWDKSILIDGNTFKLKAFTSNGTFFVPDNVNKLKIFACASGALAGAGEYILGEEFSVTPKQTVSITVGSGNTIISGAGISRTLVAGNCFKNLNQDLLGFKMGIGTSSQRGSVFGGAFGYAGGNGYSYNRNWGSPNDGSIKGAVPGTFEPSFVSGRDGISFNFVTALKDLQTLLPRLFISAGSGGEYNTNGGNSSELPGGINNGTGGGPGGAGGGYGAAGGYGGVYKETTSASEKYNTNGTPSSGMVLFVY